MNHNIYGVFLITINCFTFESKALQSVGFYDQKSLRCFRKKGILKCREIPSFLHQVVQNAGFSDHNALFYF